MNWIVGTYQVYLYNAYLTKYCSVSASLLNLLLEIRTRRNIEMDMLQENLSLKEQVTKQKRQLLKLEGKLPPTTKENIDVTVVKSPLKEGLWSAYFCFLAHLGT